MQMSARPTTSITTLGMIMTRAQIILRRQGDAEARELLHQVENVLQGVCLLERLTASEKWQERASRIAAIGAATHARVAEYAERHRIRYLQVDTPSPETGR